MGLRSGLVMGTMSSCNVTIMPTCKSKPSPHGTEEDDARGAHEVPGK